MTGGGAAGTGWVVGGSGGGRCGLGGGRAACGVGPGEDTSRIVIGGVATSRIVAGLGFDGGGAGSASTAAAGPRSGSMNSHEAKPRRLDWPGFEIAHQVMLSPNR